MSTVIDAPATGAELRRARSRRSWTPGRVASHVALDVVTVGSVLFVCRELRGGRYRPTAPELDLPGGRLDRASASAPVCTPPPAGTTAVARGEDVRGRRRSATLRRVTGYVVVALLVLVWSVWLRPAWLGGPMTLISVTGESMEPGMYTGDLAIVRRDATYEVGEVVAFRVPNEDGTAGPYVIHRIVDERGDTYTLRGDNNGHDDPWDVTDADIAGQLWLHVPSAGTLIARLADPVVAAALVAAFAAFLVMLGPEATSDRRERERPARPSGGPGGPT